MTLEDILEKRNFNDEVYLCDVHEFLGIDIPIQRARELQVEFTRFARRHS